MTDIKMSADGDSLLARAEAAIENAQQVLSETRRVIDTARLQRLNRELLSKIRRIRRLTSSPRVLARIARLH